MKCFSGSQAIRLCLYGTILFIAAAQGSAQAAAQDSSTPASRSAAGGDSSPGAAPGALTPQAQQGNLSLGLALGVGSVGVTGRYYLSDRLALQGMAGTLRELGGLTLGLDAIYELHTLKSFRSTTLSWHTGGGLSHTSGEYLGYDFKYTYISGLLGMELAAQKKPISLTLDLRYGMARAEVPGLYSGGSMDGDLMLGGRFTF